MTPSLKNPKLKIERAKEHLDVLNTELVKFIDTKPFSITTEEDSKNSIYRMRIKYEVINPKLAIIAGDTIYQLRSALDHIAWQLALITGRRPYDRTSFPIVDKNTPEKMRRFDSITQSIPIAAINEIKLLQPYLRGSAYKTDLLWKLDKLCNIDKHRVIPAHGTVLDFKVPKSVNPSFLALNNEAIVEMPIEVKAQMQFAPNPTINVLLGSEVDGLVIRITKLPEIYEYVQDNVFPRFARFFS